MTSQIMDKQITDLSNFHTTDTANKSELIDFMNRPPEKKDDDVVPSYDFMPIRPVVQSSPPPPATRSTNFDSADGNAPLRTWNSFDSETNASSGRNYNSLDADEPGKFILGGNHKPDNASLDVSFVSEIERTVKKYTDSLMHAMDGVSDQLSDLETRARNLEHLVDDLKGSIENSHESTDGKLGQLENIFREVQTGVHAIRDKQEMVEAQLQMAKLRNPKVEQVESQTTAQIDSTHPGTSSRQQLSITQPPPTLPPHNAPPPPPPQQTFQPQIQLQNQFPQNFPTHDQPPQNPSQRYHIPPPQQPQHPPPPTQQHQFQPQYPQPPTPSQPLTQPPLGHHTEETPYPPPSQTYPPAIRPSTSHPSTGVPPLSSQQFYGPPPNVHEPPSRRPSLGYSGSFSPSSGHEEPYPYSSGSHMKMQQLSSPIMGGQSGGSSYPQLPTARILPQAVPTTSGVGGGSGSGGPGNKVPIDDVVEKVTNMGFSREQVRATVQKLTENVQLVDLNVVLDKLMNDGDGEAPRGWFGR
ncbi:hypothetical protein ACJIZ3_007871 [Penstemon smallii]|uniref:UBA domain-containing protein n=1 Tax=Penstemon smallii TaxID=265156 RepID=A0ABD3T862_9LAMI